MALTLEAKSFARTLRMAICDYVKADTYIKGDTTLYIKGRVPFNWIAARKTLWSGLRALLAQLVVHRAVDAGRAFGAGVAFGIDAAGFDGGVDVGGFSFRSSRRRGDLLDLCRRMGFRADVAFGIDDGGKRGSGSEEHDGSDGRFHGKLPGLLDRWFSLPDIRRLLSGGYVRLCRSNGVGSRESSKLGANNISCSTWNFFLAAIRLDRRCP
jgi:hypothetical protein